MTERTDAHTAVHQGRISDKVSMCNDQLKWVKNWEEKFQFHEEKKGHMLSSAC